MDASTKDGCHGVRMESPSNRCLARFIITENPVSCSYTSTNWMSVSIGVWISDCAYKITATDVPLVVLKWKCSAVKSPRKVLQVLYKY